MNYFKEKGELQSGMSVENIGKAGSFE